MLEVVCFILIADLIRNTTVDNLTLQLAAVLIAALINRYLGDNATTDAVSARLREICPTIYKAEDATFSKVIQY